MPRLATVATMYDVKLASVLYENIAKAGIDVPPEVKQRLESFQAQLMKEVCAGFGIVPQEGCLAHIPDNRQIPASALAVLNRFAVYLHDVTTDPAKKAVA